MSVQRTVAAAVVAAMVLTAGCSVLTGDEPVRFESSPATVSDAATSETGYEETAVSEEVRSRTFSAGGRERAVEVTNHRAQYERQLDLGPLGTQRAGVFAVLSSPAVEVLGETFNPLADLSEEEILDRFDSQYDDLTVGDRVGNRTTTVLGQQTTVEKFDGTAALAGTEVDVFVHVTKVRHGDDFVVVVAVYPQRLPGEEENVFAMLDGLEHDDGS